MKHASQLLSAALFLVISAGSQSIATSKDAVTITNKGTHFEVIQDYTEGISHFEMGKQMYQQIISSFPEYDKIVDSYLAELFDDQNVYNLMLSRADDIKPQIPVQYRDEIDGMGSEVSETKNVVGDGKLSSDEIYLMQLLPDIAR